MVPRLSFITGRPTVSLQQGGIPLPPRGGGSETYQDCSRDTPAAHRSKLVPVSLSMAGTIKPFLLAQFSGSSTDWGVLPPQQQLLWMQPTFRRMLLMPPVMNDLICNKGHAILKCNVIVIKMSMSFKGILGWPYSLWYGTECLTGEQGLPCKYVDISQMADGQKNIL